MLRRHALVALAIALAVPLAACTEATRIPDAEPSSEVAPLFASDEEALAAATAAYEEYLSASEAIAASPPFDLDPLRTLATAEYLERESALFAELQANGYRIVGRTALAKSQLQQWYQDLEFGHVVIFYACLDVSGGRLLDEEGNDITSAERSDLANIEVEVVEGEAGDLLLNRTDSWYGEPVC